MKKYQILIIVYSMIFNIAFGQEYRRNENWSLGADPVVTFNFTNNIHIDTVKHTFLPPPYCILSSSSSTISDTNGNLLFFSNGFVIYDFEGFALQDGVYVNCPKGLNLANYYGGASLFDQTSIILPKKGNQYYVFSTGMSDSVATNYLNHVKTEFDILNYSIVDMDSNNGKGKVVVKNKILADYQHYANCAMQAVKHSNGKDWWLVKADCENNRYQEFLVKEDTILGPYYQDFPDSISGCHFYGKLYFSEDGSKMASSIFAFQYTDTSNFADVPSNYKFKGTGNNYWYIPNRQDVYDFDRCSGKLTFRNYYVIPYDTTSYPNNDYKSGLCFSPDGKLLYVSNFYTIYQIDVEDNSKVNGTFISGPDTIISKFPWYATMGVAPDGKIYVGNFGGQRKYMSYIDKPNVKGLGCDFKPSGLYQSYTNILSPPNMPNYGLGADSSNLGCEPVSVSEAFIVKNEELVVYPNPSSTIMSVELRIKNWKDSKIEMFNSMGQLVYSSPLERGWGEFEIDVSHFPKGVYYLRCLYGGQSGEHQSKKVIVE